MAGVERLIYDMLKLSENQESADIVFLVGPEEERIFAHRVLLLARCKGFKQKRGEICRIPSVSPAVFRQFILYVYTGKIMFQDQKFFEMNHLAHDFGVDELKIACEDHAICNMSVDNACKFLTSIMNSGSKCASSFIDRCITYIGEHATECVKTPAFLALSSDGLIKLISSDYFCLEEENVWRCVLAWAKHQAGVSQPTTHWTEEERLRVCQYLSGGVMNHVRLLLIDSKVFAEEVEPTGAVPIELTLERYRHAALNTNKLPPQMNQAAPPKIPVNENDKRLQPRLLLNFPGSVILKNEKMHYQVILNGWFGSSPKQTWKLVYRASTDGFAASTFHSICDGVSPTFVIALGSRGEISGGFSDVPWSKTSRKGGYIHSDKAFLFALNPPNDAGPTKFEITKKPYAICYHPDCGPIFGAGADFLIASDCNNDKDSYSNLPHSYNGPGASSSSMFGDYNFLIVDYEVYTTAAPITAANQGRK